MAERTVTFKGNPLSVAGPQLKAGDKAPEFSCAAMGAGGLEIVTLSKTPATARLFSVVPSLDTPVCDQQTRRFDKDLAGMKEKIASFTISLDMPFAQKRFCDSANIANMKTLSDLHDQSFGKSYGVLIKGLPIPLLQRSIFVLDKTGKITYCEYVPEVTQHPNYEKAVEALKAIA